MLTKMNRTAVAITTVLMWALAASVAHAQKAGGFEAAPVLPGAKLAPAALLKGPLHTVAEPVKMEGYFGRFVIESKVGKFSVAGERMLTVRVNELRAIQELQKIHADAAFQDALKNSASASVRVVKNAVTDPEKTVENVGKGVGSIFGSVKNTLSTATAAVTDSATDLTSSKSKPKSAAAPAGEPEPPSFTGDPFGYNKARREWAKKLQIDPYTSNPVLQPLLDDAARATFAGNFAVGLVTGVVGMTATLETTVQDEVWNTGPNDLLKANEAKLLALGVAPRTVRDFYRNKWFTPTLQTALTALAVKLGKLPGIESLIATAAQVQGETRARFLVDSVRMLVTYSEKEARFTSLRMSRLVPVGITADGTAVAGAAIDYAWWDKGAAEFTQRKGAEGKKKVLLIAGAASERANAELTRAGFTVRTGLRP
ncbi:MAG: hypothetical protein ACREUW_17680 [Burkholderiales bacterium]